MSDYPVTPLTPPLSEQEIIRRQKLQGLIDAGQNPYEITRYDVTHHSQEIIDNFADDAEPIEVSIAGRMMARRVMGKASFASILDGQGSIQIYVTRDDLGEEAYAAIEKYGHRMGLAMLEGFSAEEKKQLGTMLDRMLSATE